MRLERGILGVGVDQSAGCHQDGRIMRPALFNRLVTSRLTSGARVNPDRSFTASVGSIAPG